MNILCTYYQQDNTFTHVHPLRRKSPDVTQGDVHEQSQGACQSISRDELILLSNVEMTGSVSVSNPLAASHFASPAHAPRHTDRQARSSMRAHFNQREQQQITRLGLSERRLLERAAAPGQLGYRRGRGLAQPFCSSTSSGK